LREVLGPHVAQKGSLVDADKTRFDFSHNAALTAEEIRQVEELVNREILANNATEARVMSFDEATKQGAMALFGEKYGDKVRVLNIGNSCELCGGTHVTRTGDIGLFKIISESGIAAGIRRVEAVTGEGALHRMQQLTERIDEAALLLKTNPDDLLPKMLAIQDQSKALLKELAQLKSKLAAHQGVALASQAIDIKGIKVLAAMLNDADANTLRDVVEQLKTTLKTAVIVLAATQEDKVSLVAGVTANTTAKVKAGNLLNFVASQLGGKGGGRPELAQGGASNPEGLPKALLSVASWVEQCL
jgi:alanyl-tRNA synthetase